MLTPSPLHPPSTDRAAGSTVTTAETTTARDRLLWPLVFGVVGLGVASYAMTRFDGSMRAKLFGSGILAVEFAATPGRWADLVATNGAHGMAAVRESLRWDPAYIALYAVVLTLLMARVRRIDPRLPRSAGWFPALGGVFDLVEDACLWLSLDAPSGPLLATAAGCATVKFALLGAVLGYAVRSWLRAGGPTRRFWDRLSRRLGPLRASLVIGSLAVVFAIIGLGAAKILTDEALLTADHREVPATVTDTASGRGPLQLRDVRYAVDGIPVVARVGAPTFTTLRQGDLVTVDYDPWKPDRARLAGHPEVPLIFILGVTLSLVAVTWRAAARRQRGVSGPVANR